jgi:predicted nucleotidyltransferase
LGEGPNTSEGGIGMKMHGREVVVSMSGGSQMRNLDTTDSDVDLKYFVLPTKEDLYSSKVFKEFVSTPELDTDVQDVRRLDNLLYKANPAYLDLLFSPDIEVQDSTYDFWEMKEIIKMREDIARMNLPYLFDSCMGSINQNKSTLTKPTSDKVRALIEEHGYNPKKLMMAVHFAKFMRKYHDQGFKDYGKAIWYEGPEREYMLNLKRGSHPYEYALEMLQSEIEYVEKLKADFKAQEFNSGTYEKLQNLLRSLIFESIEAGAIQ